MPGRPSPATASENGTGMAGAGKEVTIVTSQAETAGGLDTAGRSPRADDPGPSASAAPEACAPRPDAPGPDAAVSDAAGPDAAGPDAAGSRAPESAAGPPDRSADQAPAEPAA